MTTPLKLTLSALVAFLILAFLYFFFDVHIMVHRLFSSNIREEVVRPHRGRILASDGTPLAETVRRYNIYMDCCVVKDEKVWADESRALAQEIALVLPTRSAPEWWQYFHEARQAEDKFIPIVQEIDGPMKDSLSRRTLGYTEWDNSGVGLE